MRATTRAAGLLSLLFLLTPQTTLSGQKFAHAAPTKDGKVCPSAEVDVVVIGGGFSGMSSAYALHQAGLKVVVLEARDRLGGRSRSIKLSSGPGIVELGATWINNSTQPAVFALTQEFGLETIEQYDQGFDIRQGVDGSIEPQSEEEIANDETALAILALQNEMLAAMGEAINRTNIEVFDNFPKEEDVSFAEWIAQKGFWDNPYLRAVCSQLSSSIVGREPHEIGAHYFFDYVASGNGISSLLSAGKDGAQSLMIKTGTTSIATSIADALIPGSVFLNNPVTSISQYESKVSVITKKGKRFQAKKVILANIPSSYNIIDFNPTLPSDKQGLSTESLPGVYAKVIVSYSSAWWRDAGLSGNLFSFTGPITYGLEIAVPSLEQFSLALFVAGDFATEWFAPPDSEKEPAIIEHLATLVGEKLADQARDTIEINYIEWTNEEYIGAGPTDAMGPGMLRKYGDTLRQPFGHLHFASTETAFKWKGYLEGAVTAGQRAAQEVIEVLGD